MNQSRIMLNFDFLEKCLRIVCPSNFVYDLSKKKKKKSFCILLTDLISLSDCLFFLKYWALLGSLHGRFQPWVEILLTYQAWNFIPWYRRNQLFFIFVLYDKVFVPELDFLARFSKAELKFQPGIENDFYVRVCTIS